MIVRKVRRWGMSKAEYPYYGFRQGRYIVDCGDIDVIVQDRDDDRWFCGCGAERKKCEHIKAVKRFIKKENK